MPAFQLNYRLELNFNGGSLNFKGKAFVICGFLVIYKKTTFVTICKQTSISCI